MHKTFESESTLASRAYQAYIILIGLAMSHQTIQYRDLCKKMDFGVGPILSGPLGRIMNWCQREGLPALTAIVVEKRNGVPSTGLITVPNGDFPKEQQKVYAFDWFSIFPPTLKELAS